MRWLRTKIDSCHRGVAHAEGADNVLLVRLFPGHCQCWGCSHRYNGWDGIAAFDGERELVVGGGHGVIYRELIVHWAIRIIGR